MSLDSPANDKVRAALERAISEEGEIGIQVAAYLGDELVIDCWAGLADRDTGRKVDGDTLFNVFSVTKAVPSTAVHVQAERGFLAYDDPIAKHWPEFGLNGKSEITIRDALNHQTGMPQMPEGTSPVTICDWDWTVGEIAKQSAILPRGRPAYQSMSFGWILGEIVRRTDTKRRSFRDFVADEIARPYGIADLWIGIDDSVESRIAKLVDEGSGATPPADSLFAKSLPLNVQLVPGVFERPEVRRATIAGVGGIFSARSEARFWAILANGGMLDGRRLLSQDRVDAACLPRPGGNEPDPVYFNAPMTLSQGGYWRYSAATPFTCPAKGSRTICAPGAGGSLGWADPDERLAVAFCHNRMIRPRTCDDHPLTRIADAIREALGVI